jgi:hypothetical protein
MSDLSNLPIPDQLAHVRERIKALQDREAELRQYLIDHPDDRHGNAWAAEVKTVTSQRLDIKELRAMHPDVVAEFTFPTKTLQVVLLGVSEDGEILSPKETRKLQEQANV